MTLNKWVLAGYSGFMSQEHTSNFQLAIIFKFDYILHPALANPKKFFFFFFCDNSNDFMKGFNVSVKFSVALQTNKKIFLHSSMQRNVRKSQTNMQKKELVLGFRSTWSLLNRVNLNLKILFSKNLHHIETSKCVYCFFL